jgi:hypothetical protein
MGKLNSGRKNEPIRAVEMGQEDVIASGIVAIIQKRAW